MGLGFVAKRLAFSFVFMVLLTAWKPPPDIESDQLDVPFAERALLPEIEGWQWVILPDPDEERPFSLIDLKLQEDHSYIMSTAEPDDGEEFRLVLLTTDNPDIFVALYEEQYAKRTVTKYHLFVRSRGGSWGWLVFLGDMYAPLDGARVAYLDPIVRRHGISPEEKRPLDFGKVPSVAAIRSLFSDPDFLAGLNIPTRPFLQILPRNSVGIADPAADELWWDEIKQSRFESVPFELNAGQTVSLNDLPADWLAAAPDGSLEQSDDGRIIFNSGDSQSAFWLLNVDRKKQFLGIEEYTRHLYNEEREDYDLVPVFRYSLVELGHSETVEVSALSFAAYDFSRWFNDNIMRLRHRAAGRHGIVMSGDILGEGASAQSLRDLFNDPEFQVGLSPAEPSYLDLVPRADPTE